MVLNPYIKDQTRELNLFSEVAERFGVNHALAEFAARVCYKSTMNMGKSPTFLKKKIVDVNHMDVFEHHYATVFFDEEVYPIDNKYVHSVSENAINSITASDRVLLTLGLNIKEYLPGVYGPAKERKNHLLWGETVENGQNVSLLAYEENGKRFTWLLEGISIFTATQITRHRVGSFSQQSARYVSLEKGGWNGIIPPAFNREQQEILQEAYKFAQEKYAELKSLGAKNEDARSVFPVGFTTRMVVSFDNEGLDHFFDLRLPKAAQWEIRQIAESMFYQVQSIGKN